MGRENNATKNKYPKFKIKLLSITAAGLLFVITALAVAPVLFKGAIIRTLKDTANKNLRASIDFKDVSLSLLQNFPKASITISDLLLLSAAPFEQDTLFYANTIQLKMELAQLFRKKEEALRIQSFLINNATVNIRSNKKGAVNYDILKKEMTAKTAEKTGSTTGNDLIFAIEDYQITNSTLRYKDATSGIKLEILQCNHSGFGDLSAVRSALHTKTSALVSMRMDSTEYLSKNTVDLQAILQLDFTENKYSFLENKLLLNQIPLVFDGFVKMHEDFQEVDITFNSPPTDFKYFLENMPATYATDLKKVKTSGTLGVQGFFKGKSDHSHIPKFNIAITADKASFQYPDLPKAVSEIHISAALTNSTGILEDTYFQIDPLSFKIDEDSFNASAKIQQLLHNPHTRLAVKGRLDLGKLSKAYPMAVKTELSGILDADIQTSFDMNSIKTRRYKNTQNKGSLQLSNFHFYPDQLANPLEISKAALSFDTQTVQLHDFWAKTGKSDFKAKGKIHNLLGFLLQDEQLEGIFDLDAGTFAVADFMLQEELSETKQVATSSTAEGQKVSIPAFLDCSINATANTVLYHNLSLKNVRGTLKIKDQKATITQLSSSLFSGHLGLTGEIDTKQAKPAFGIQLKISGFDIASSFKELPLFQFLTPLAHAMHGKLNSDISLSGNLNNDLSLNFNTLRGSLLGSLENASLVKENSAILQAFDKNLPFIELKDIALTNLKIASSFADGKVLLKPMHLEYQDIAINISGTHNLDKSLFYTVKLDVPAKYLGNEASKMLAQLTNNNLSKTKVPVQVSLEGSFENPRVKTDLKNAVADLTRQLSRSQKEKLADQGKNLLSGLLSKNKDSSAASNEHTDKEAVKNLLDGFLGKKKKKSAAK